MVLKIALKTTMGTWMGSQMRHVWHCLMQSGRQTYRGHTSLYSISPQHMGHKLITFADVTATATAVGAIAAVGGPVLASQPSSSGPG